MVIFMNGEMNLKNDADQSPRINFAPQVPFLSVSFPSLNLLDFTVSFYVAVFYGKIPNCCFNSSRKYLLCSH